MNEAQLLEVTNVPNDLCPAQVALFSPGYDLAGGQWWLCETPGLLCADAPTASCRR